MFKCLFLLLATFVFACGSDNPSKNIPDGLNRPLEDANVELPSLLELLPEIKSFYAKHKSIKGKEKEALFIHGAGQANSYELSEAPNLITDAVTQIEEDYRYWSEKFLNGENLFLLWRSDDLGYKWLLSQAHYMAAALDSYDDYSKCISGDSALSDKCLSADAILVPEVFFRERYFTESLDDFKKACSDAFKDQKAFGGEALRAEIISHKEGEPHLREGSELRDYCYGSLPFKGETKRVYLGSHFRAIAVHSMGGLLAANACLKYGYCPKNIIVAGTPFRGSMQADLANELGFDRQLSNIIADFKIDRSSLVFLDSNTNKSLSLANQQFSDQSIARVGRYQARSALCLSYFKGSEEEKYQSQIEHILAIEKLSSVSAECNAFNYLYSDIDGDIGELCEEKEEFIKRSNGFPVEDASKAVKDLAILHYDSLKEESMIKGAFKEKAFRVYTTDGVVDNRISCQSIAPYAYRKDGDYSDNQIKKRTWFSGDLRPKAFSLSLGTHGDLVNFIKNQKINNSLGLNLYMNHQWWWQKSLSKMGINLNLQEKDLSEVTDGMAFDESTESISNKEKEVTKLLDLNDEYPVNVLRYLGHDGRLSSEIDERMEIIRLSGADKKGSYKELLDYANKLNIAKGLSACYSPCPAKKDDQNCIEDLSSDYDFNEDGILSHADILSCPGYRVVNLSDLKRLDFYEKRYVYLNQEKQDEGYFEREQLLIRPVYKAKEVSHKKIKEADATLGDNKAKAEIYCKDEDRCFIKFIAKDEIWFEMSDLISKDEFLDISELYFKDDGAYLLGEKLHCYNRWDNKLSFKLDLKGVDVKILGNVLLIEDGERLYYRDLSIKYHGKYDLVNGANQVKKVYSDGSAFAVLRGDGSVVDWGNLNVSYPGQEKVKEILEKRLIDGDKKPEKMSSAVGVYSNGDATVEVKEDGSVVAWGSVYYGGDLGVYNGSTKTKDVSYELNDKANPVKMVYSNIEAFAALREDGSVVAWGRAVYGGDLEDKAKELDGSIKVKDIYSTGSAFAALREDGSVVPWGEAVYGGDLGDKVKELDGTNKVKDIYSNVHAFAALREDGSVVAWGNSRLGGDLGDKAKELDGSIKVKDIYSNGSAFAALREDGSVVAWGSGYYGGDLNNGKSVLDLLKDLESPSFDYLNKYMQGFIDLTENKKLKIGPATLIVENGSYWVE